MAEQSKTVDAALTLLTALGDGGDASTAQLARRLGLSRTATARLLATLEAHRLARRTPAGWILGDGVLDLARHVAGTQLSPNGGGPCPTTDASVRCHPSATRSSGLPTGASTPRR